MKKSTAQPENIERSRIVFGLLESIQRDGAVSQRRRASEFGVALGLVNAYINYCIKKGLVRVKKIPARRYSYYVTPKGFAEKSRLAITLVSNSFHSFRQAREQYTEAFRTLQERGVKRVVLIGLSELAEVAVLSAADTEVAIAAIIDPSATVDRYLGLPVQVDWKNTPDGFDGAIITDLINPAASCTAAAFILDEDRIIAPAILGMTGAREDME